MNILLLSAGGGGGNILRSVKELFRRDLIVAQKSDAKYAERIRRSITTRFLDTNAFSLSDVPPDERLLIGANGRHFGAQHDPAIARAAFEESRNEVERLIREYGVVVVVASGGKGTGAGTIFPIAEIARRQRKLVIPIFVRPSFEHHEVEKRRYDHALAITQQFDEAGIRFIEILNERGYVERDPQPQSVVWERMNRPIARGLRGLLYVLSDLSQVDPSDLSALFAGEGRLRMGFAEINPPAGGEPTTAEIDAAAQACWDDSYYAFRGRVGTSLICIQGDWSNIVDARLKSRLAQLAVGDTNAHPYNPLYARAGRTPKPWGVTAIFAEYTGTAEPLDLDWTPPMRVIRSARPSADVDSIVAEPLPAASEMPVAMEAAVATGHVVALEPVAAMEPVAEASAPFATIWELAVAINRQTPAALAIARDGADSRISVDGLEVRKLLTTVWFRSAFQRLSDAWRARLLDALVEAIVVPNHSLKTRRGMALLHDLEYEDIKEIYSKAFVSDAVRPDLELLLNVARLWGAEALRRLNFAESSQPIGSSRLGGLLQSLRP